MTLDDATGRIEAVVFERAFKKCEALMQKDTVVIIEGELSKDNFTGGIRLTVSTLASIEEARAMIVSALRITLLPSKTVNMASILSVLKTSPGKTPVLFKYRNPKGSVWFKANPKFNVYPSEDLLSSLRVLENIQSLKCQY